MLLIQERRNWTLRNHVPGHDTLKRVQKSLPLGHLKAHYNPGKCLSLNIPILPIAFLTFGPAYETYGVDLQRAICHLVPLPNHKTLFSKSVSSIWTRRRPRNVYKIKPPPLPEGPNSLCWEECQGSKPQVWPGPLYWSWIFGWLANQHTTTFKEALRPVLRWHSSQEDEEMWNTRWVRATNNALLQVLH